MSKFPPIAIAAGLLVAPLALASCGGSGTTTVTVVSTATSGDQVSADPAATGGTTSEGGITIVGAPNAVYLPNQVGGNFHQVMAIAHNTTDKTVRVDAQFTLKDAKGLVGTTDANTTILAGQDGLLLSDSADLPRPFRHGNISVVTAVGDALVTDSALLQPGALTISKPTLTPGGGLGLCQFRAVVTNNTSKKLDITAVQFVAIKDGLPLAAGYTYPSLFPKTPKVVTDDAVSDVLCPSGATIKAYWAP